MSKKTSHILPVLTLGIVAIALCGCTKSLFSEKQDTTKQTKLLSQLEIRIQQLERRMGQEENTSSDNDNKAPAGPIKSLTFRMGSKDDRLRIYWADGSNSDLPCTQEQSILACG